MSGKHGEEDPVGRLQEEARWSSFTNSWARSVTGNPRPWVRRFIIVFIVLGTFVSGLIGLIELVTRDGSSQVPFPSDCPTVEPSGVTVARCLDFPVPTGP